MSLIICILLYNLNMNSLVSQEQTATCHGPSMSPVIKDKDRVIIKPYPDKTSVERGDIIQYIQTKKICTTIHRVIRITPEGFITRGDNNNKIDPYIIPFENIIGKVYKIIRKNRKLYPKNGLAGLIIHKLMLLRKYILYCIVKFLRLFSSLP
ncbi:MAG: signal peptidase I [Candidatus Saganbacteria bacterium]|nr:signal peptidase I [Candidatus Saganbacteria bacterium]